MTSIIDEIQREASDNNSSLSSLLRKVKIIASKLDLEQPLEWVDSELEGYDQIVPEYRMLFGHARARNPFHGWQPVIFDNADFENSVCRRAVRESIRKIEHLVAAEGETLKIELSGEAASLIAESAGVPYTFPVAVFFGKSGLVGILDVVRNKIISWTLALQKAGIKGDGVSFTPKEKEAAHSPGTSYHINHISNFTGNLGGGIIERDAIGSQNTLDLTQLEEFIAQLRLHANQMGLTVAAEANLKSHIEELEDEVRQPNPKDGRVKSILKEIRTLAEGAAGSLVASGVLSVLSSLQVH